MKIQSAIYKFFHYIDLFKVPFQFYFKGKTKRSSTAGLLFSLIIFAFLFYQFLYSEFFTKVSPNVITQTKEGTEHITLDFNEKKKLFIAVIDRYSLERTTDHTLFELEAKYYDQGQVINKKIRPCIYSDLQNSMTEEYFYNLGYDKIFCMENKTFSLKRFGEDKEWKFIQFLIYPCRNGTSNITCKSKEIIYKSLKNKYFSVAFETVDIDAHNYKNPLIVNFEPKTIVLNPDLKKTHTDTIKLAQVITDDSWFFSGSSIKTENGHMIDFIGNEYELRADFSDPFINWILMPSNKQFSCTRNYQKLPETLASLAGTANLFWFFGFYFCQIAAHVRSMKFIMNKLYDFEKPRKKPRVRKTISPKDGNSFNRSKFWLDPLNQNSKQISSSRLIKENTEKNKQNLASIDHLAHNNMKIKENLTTTLHTLKKNQKYSENNFNNLIINNKEILNDLNGIIIEMPEESNGNRNDKNDKTNKDNKNIPETNIFHDLLNKNPIKKITNFKLSLFEYFKYIIKKSFCFTLTEKEKLIKNAERIYRNKLDISEILLRLEDIEKMKNLILNSDQYRLFSHLKKNNFFQEKEIKNGLLLKSYKKCENEQFSCRISKFLIENCDSKQLF